MRPRGLKGLLGQGRSLRDIMLDKGLAALGDALVNFAYSVALSLASGKPMGSRLDNKLLWEALRASGLRDKAPRRMSRHELADAAEALLAYGWLSGLLGFWNIVEALQGQDLVSSLSELLRALAEKIEH
ncbi:MAG TPA: hypothetical protein ENF78_00890 [Candidatus Bathyarchaeota archaeon]|nr:hypothetical protein [Candidatus Bathyarchaeota archaeon]